MEKMLANTDANKFSNYLQTGAADLAGKRGGGRKLCPGNCVQETPATKTYSQKNKNYK